MVDENTIEKKISKVVPAQFLHKNPAVFLNNSIYWFGQISIGKTNIPYTLKFISYEE